MCAFSRFESHEAADNIKGHRVQGVANNENVFAEIRRAAR